MTNNDMDQFLSSCVMIADNYERQYGSGAVGRIATRAKTLLGDEDFNVLVGTFVMCGEVRQLQKSKGA